MLRTLVLIFCCMCVAIVLSEAAGLFLLWQRGILTEHHIKEIQLVFANNAGPDKQDKDEVKTAPFPSLQEVTQSRAVKLFDLDKRETELAVLKNLATDSASGIDKQQEAFRIQRKTFEDHLAKINERLTTASTEQARGVLLAMPPEDAVEKLMQLSIEDDVILLKGMPEKAIAKILKEFKTTPEQLERSRKVFEAINRGSPSRELLEAAKKDLGVGNDAPRSE